MFVWLQPSEICAVSDSGFARWMTRFCRLPFWQMYLPMLQGNASASSVSLRIDYVSLTLWFRHIKMSRYLWTPGTGRSDNVPRSGKFGFPFQKLLKRKMQILFAVNVILFSFCSCEALFFFGIFIWTLVCLYRCLILNSFSTVLKSCGLKN